MYSPSGLPYMWVGARQKLTSDEFFRLGKSKFSELQFYSSKYFTWIFDIPLLVFL